jgi:hypothetical protein
MLEKLKAMLGGLHKMNNATFAYHTLYNRHPKIPVFGKSEYPTKVVEGIKIDENIPSKTFKVISNIPNIKVKAASQGWNESHPTYLIFALINNNDKRSAEKVVIALNEMEDIRAAYNISDTKGYHICATWHTWYRELDFELWWNSLPMKIENSIK